MRPSRDRPGALTHSASLGRMDLGELSDTDETLRTVDGRLPGERGRKTRTRLLEVTADMLRAGSYRDLAVVEIAREAGVSPATFYQYFPDVETAIFFMADHIVVDGHDRLAALVRDLDADADTETAMAGARALADGFLEFWREFYSILRVLDLGAAEKDDAIPTATHPAARRTDRGAGPGRRGRARRRTHLPRHRCPCSGRGVGVDAGARRSPSHGPARLGRRPHRPGRSNGSGHLLHAARPDPLSTAIEHRDRCSRRARAAVTRSPRSRPRRRTAT